MKRKFSRVKTRSRLPGQQFRIPSENSDICDNQHLARIRFSRARSRFFGGRKSPHGASFEKSIALLRRRLVPALLDLGGERRGHGLPVGNAFLRVIARQWALIPTPAAQNPSAWVRNGVADVTARLGRGSFNAEYESVLAKPGNRISRAEPARCSKPAVARNTS